MDLAGDDPCRMARPDRTAGGQIDPGRIICIRIY